MAEKADRNLYARKSFTLRQKLEILRGQLEIERTTFEAQWRDLGDNINPRRTRFTVSDVNKGDYRNNKILDGTATMAARTLQAGMMSGVTSPARPWFRLTLADQELAERGDIKMWLHKTAQRITTSFLRSNLYNVLPTIYGDLGTFGTGCMYVEEDFKGGVMRFYPFLIGSYMISQNENLQVDTFYREFQMSVRQIINKFGVVRDGKITNWENFSEQVRNLYDNNQMEIMIDVAHCILPNQDYDIKKPESRFKKYSSVYYERGTGESGNRLNYDAIDYDRYLSIKGYDFFPVFSPRWQVAGEDTYATNCPGMVALGDIRQLQTMEKRALQALEKTINPPMVAPTSLRNQKVSQLPGGITYVDTREGQGGFRAAHEINYNFQYVEEKEAQCRNRIQRAFFEDLFLMLAQTNRSQITAREIEERHEEKLLALGPVLEQLNQDLLDPLIDIAFDIHMKQGLIEQPPEELQGQELKVEYISIMHQAQKLSGLGAVERLVGFAGSMFEVDPTVKHKINTHQAIDVYGDMVGAPPSIINDDETVQRAMQAEQQQQQAMQQAEMLKQSASAARDLSQAEVTEDNMLGDLAEGIGVV